MRVRLVLPARFLRIPDFDDEGPPLDSGQKEAGRRLRLFRRIMSEEEDEVVVAGLAGAAPAVGAGGCWTGLPLMG